MRIFSDGPGAAREEGDGEGEGESEGAAGSADAGGGPAIDLGWQYIPELCEIHHAERRKRIRLSDLDAGLKIIRLLAAIEARPELDVDGLIDALEYASWDCHGQSLGSTLEAHSDGALIAWTAAPAVNISGPSFGPQSP